MKTTIFRLLLIPLFVTLPYLGFTQEMTQADYSRAINSFYYQVNNRQALNLFVDANWLPDNTGFWHLAQNAQGREFQKVVLPKGTVTPLFDHQKLADTLTHIFNQKINPKTLPFVSLTTIDSQTFRFQAGGKTFQIDAKTSTLTAYQDTSGSSNAFESKSPDGKWVAYTKDYNLFIKSTTTGKEYQLSTDGSQYYRYGHWYGGELMEGEEEDLPRRFFANWSPDSKWLQSGISDIRNAEKMYLLDWTKNDQFRPKLLSYFRASPGDSTLAKRVPVFFNVDTKKPLVTDLPTTPSYSVVTFKFASTPGIVYADWTDRSNKQSHIVSLDLNTNKISPVNIEKSETTIDNFDFILMKSRNQMILISERSGWRQLYLLDLKTNRVSPITNGEYYVDGIEAIDESKGLILFKASGRENGRNPYLSHFYSIEMSGKNLKLLTPENAHHEINLSPDKKYFLDNYSTAMQPTKTVLRYTRNGKLIKEISAADITKLTEKGWNAPEVFESIARDGKTKIYGVMWKPSNFDPSKKYPIIDHSYTGPQTQKFPRSFRSVFSTDEQPLAELGFIVVVIDGMGTTGRSKAFHDVSYGNIGDNLLDHMMAIKDLGKKYDWIDLDRVGIYGHSAGGYDAAHALLRFPDFYKVAVASSGNHDHRMAKASWPEKYVGWPVDSVYHKISNITMAKNLKGKLLLVHGGLDNNVNPSATFRFAEALINAHKEFDLFIFPSQRHNYAQHSIYFIKKRWNYFIEHLAGAKPLWNYDWK